MITDFTQATLDSGVLAMFLGEMAYFKASQETFESLRPEAEKLIGQVRPLRGIGLPSTWKEMTEQEGEIIATIMSKLSEERSRVGGDVLPLTVFMLTHCVYKAILFAAFGEEEQWAPYRQLLESCFRDVGLNSQEQISKIEARAKASKSAEQHGEILEQLGQLRGQLVDRLKVAGLPAEQAEQMTDTASETFLQRVRRWASNQQARDTAEAALWAALDFVPGGTGVKLGIKVASAIRRATKKQHVP